MAEISLRNPYIILIFLFLFAVVWYLFTLDVYLFLTIFGGGAYWTVKFLIKRKVEKHIALPTVTEITTVIEEKGEFFDPEYYSEHPLHKYLFLVCILIFLWFLVPIWFGEKLTFPTPWDAWKFAATLIGRIFGTVMVVAGIFGEIFVRVAKKLPTQEEEIVLFEMSERRYSGEYYKRGVHYQKYTTSVAPLYLTKNFLYFAGECEPLPYGDGPLLIPLKRIKEIRLKEKDAFCVKADGTEFVFYTNKPERFVDEINALLVK